jgi:hypothetical protein
MLPTRQDGQRADRLPASMITTAPNQILDEVLDSVAPLLTASGYKKAARSFVTLTDGVARVIQFQTSQLKKPEEASFTLSLLVTSVVFHEAFAGKPFPRNVGSAEPVIQAAIGRLMPDGEPVWWSLKPGVSSGLIAKEVQALLRDPVLPFLARFHSEAALLDELERGEALPGFSAMRERCRATLLAREGRKPEAGKVLTALLEANSAAGLERFRDSVNELAKRLGVKL